MFEPNAEPKSVVLWTPEARGTDLDVVTQLLNLFEQEAGTLNRAAADPRDNPCES